MRKTKIILSGIVVFILLTMTASSILFGSEKPRNQLPVRTLYRQTEWVLPSDTMPYNLMGNVTSSKMGNNTPIINLTAAPFVIMEESISTINMLNVLNYIELGYNDSTSENVVDTIYAPTIFVDPSKDDSGVYVLTRSAPYHIIIPANVTFWARAFSGGGSTNFTLTLTLINQSNWLNQLYYQNNGIQNLYMGNLLKNQKWSIPLSSLGTAVVGGSSAYTYGNNVQVITNANESLITQITTDAATGFTIGRYVQVEVDLGNATTGWIPVYRTAFNHGIGAPTIEPPIYVPKGLNVSLRVACNSAGQGGTFHVKYQEIKG